MAVYQYMAKDTAGRKFCGVYTDVESVPRLREELGKIGCVLLKARREKAAVKRGKIKRAEVVTFAYKFSGMFAAGLPILNCLEVLQDQTENPAFQYIISDIRQNVQAGSSLRDACAKHSSIFSNFFVEMAGAGESSGSLAVTLEKSAAYLEKREDIRRKVLSAFAYPAAVTAMCFVAVTFILTFVMPTFIDLYKQVRVPLPGPTRALVSLSWVVGHYWPAILATVGLAVLFVQRLAKKPSVRMHWDTFKLHVPLFAGLNRMLVVSHFTRTFAMLSSVGIPLIEAMDVASAVAHNHKLTRIAEELKQMIKAGVTVAESLRSFKIFPTIITQLAASGEQAGQLPQMLNKGADLIDKEIDAKISSLLAKLEPLLTVAMGLVVGLILVGAYLPLFDYMGHLLEPGAQ